MVRGAASSRADSTMAQSVQNVTLALTLPITCHICLSKVRKPVVCANQHVFCSLCIELWLKKNNQCPACRVPITPENPCKDIIGGSDENECVLSHSIRKNLRKTRLDLLHKVYEDEIESLLKEIEELKRANNKLEKKLSEHVTPPVLTITSDSVIKGSEDKTSIDSKTLEEILKKLQAASDTVTKFTGDIEMLQEENKRLKSENIEFGRENLRLKSEVVGRSPQKFGRFTVAVLQAKVDQYEREMSRLKKALERSDQYIEDLKGQIAQLKQPSGAKQEGRSNCEEQAPTEENDGAGALYKWQDVRQSKIFPNQTHEFGDGEKQRDFTDACLSSNGCISSLDNLNMFTGNAWSVGSDVSEDCSDNGKWKKSHAKDVLEEDKVEMCTPSKGRECVEYSSPSNSLPLGSLQLNTPSSKDVATVKQPIGKPLTYHRRLVFDNLSETAPSAGENKNVWALPKSPTIAEQTYPLFLKCQQETQKVHSEWDQHQMTEPEGNPSIVGSHNSTSNNDPFGIVCEDSMDAAYFDKVKELHSMISEFDNRKSLSIRSSSSLAPTKNSNTLANEQQNNDQAIEDPLCSQSCHPQGKVETTSSDSTLYFSSSPWKLFATNSNYEFKVPEFLNDKPKTDSDTLTFQSSDPLALSTVLNGDISTDDTLNHDLPKSSNSPAKRKLPSHIADCHPKFPKH